MSRGHLRIDADRFAQNVPFHAGPVAFTPQTSDRDRLIKGEATTVAGMGLREPAVRGGGGLPSIPDATASGLNSRLVMAITRRLRP